MNMHGVILPEAGGGEEEERERAGIHRRLGGWARRNRMFLLIVMLPTLLVAAYYLLVASDQYASEAHFVVRTADAQPQTPVGLGAVLSLTGGMTSSQAEAMSVADYLDSQQAVAQLRGDAGLVARFQRGFIDPLSRLHDGDTNPEDLLDYYRKRVHVAYSTDTGITTLSVRAFTPKDSFAIITRLLAMGEARVNLLNQRAYRDAVADAQAQVAEAEGKLNASQAALTSFRASHRDIDPTGTGEAQIGLVSTLTQGLAQARAQLASMGRFIRHDSPQYQAQQARVAALEAQVAAQSGKLAGSGSTIASSLGNYEDLRLRQEFAAKSYAAAATALEEARQRAARQQLYLVRIVDPNLPVKSEYPKRGRIIATVFFSLLIAYGIGWLIAAGVREHSL